MSFEATRVSYSYENHTDATAAEIFPLLCPVREDDWIIGWKEAAALIFSESGFAEKGAVFQTQHGDGALQTWVVTEYEPPTRIAFAYFGGDVVTRLEIDLVEGDGRTRSTWTTSMVGTSPAGNASVAAFTGEAHGHMRAGIGIELQHYLATGQLISEEELRRQLAASAHG